MKKLYFSVLSFVAAFTASAQLTQSNHAPAAGDTYEMYQCDTVSPGPAGANVLWNFAAINTHSSIIKSYTAQAVSTTTYPAANVALASSGTDVSYLGSSTSSLSYYGGNISVGSISGNITYTSPAVYGSYPMNMNTSATSPVGGTVYISAFGITGSFTGNSSLMVDGSGTITLPGSLSFTNTLRVVTSQTMNVTSAAANATVTLVNYDYYADGIKAPVFEVATSTAIVSFLGNPSTTTQTLVLRNKNAATPPPTPTTTVGFIDHTANNYNVLVYPNPSSNVVNVVTNNPDARFVSVYDVTGKLMEKQSLTDGKVKVDVSSFNKGLYLYTVSTADNRAIRSGKFTVSE